MTPGVLQPILAAKIEHWPVERLIPYARNARTHSVAQVAQIARSIQTFGFTNPILVDGAQGILAGHGRLDAARLLKLAVVPVIVLDHLTEAERRAYILADNKLALNAGWDDDVLAAELRAIQEMDFDLELTGFDSKELEALFAKTEETPESEGRSRTSTAPPRSCRSGARRAGRSGHSAAGIVCSVAIRRTRATCRG